MGPGVVLVAQGSHVHISMRPNHPSGVCFLARCLACARVSFFHTSASTMPPCKMHTSAQICCSRGELKCNSFSNRRRNAVGQYAKLIEPVTLVESSSPKVCVEILPNVSLILSLVNVSILSDFPEHFVKTGVRPPHIPDFMPPLPPSTGRETCSGSGRSLAEVRIRLISRASKARRKLRSECGRGYTRLA